MNRSAGVTVIAVLQLLGSLFSLAMGALMAAILAFAPLPAKPDSPMPLGFKTLFSVIVVTMYVLPAIWGLVTAIGLFRLKSWARVSTIVFSALLIAFGMFSLLAIVMIAVIPIRNQPASAKIFSAVMMASLAAIQLSVAIWWIVYLTRPRVKAQFAIATAVAVTGDQVVAANAGAERRPLSITVIACFLLAGAAFFPMAIAMRWPAAIFTTVVTSWSAVLLYGAFFVVNAWIGIGLLRYWPFTRTAAIGYLIFGFVNSSVFWLVPGSQARILTFMEMEEVSFPWMKMWQQQDFVFDPTRFARIGMVFGLLFCLVEIYFLVTRKQRYERAALGARAG